MYIKGSQPVVRVPPVVHLDFLGGTRRGTQRASFFLLYYFFILPHASLKRLYTDRYLLSAIVHLRDLYLTLCTVV